MNSIDGHRGLLWLVPEALADVVVHHADGLHERVADG